MANPSITISPAAPAPGQTVTATVVYSPHVAFSATDQDGNVGTLTVGQVSLTAPGKTITKVSDSGTVGVFTLVW